MDAETMLWYTEPAADFDHALPIGNGRIGAMVFGGEADEVLKLNEDSVWSGGKRNRNNPDAREGLEEVRALLREENIAEAEKIAFQKLQGVTPNSRHYMPLGNLNLHMDFPGKPKQYVRSLDLERALSTVRFDAGDRGSHHPDSSSFHIHLYQCRIMYWSCTLSLANGERFS